jgi:DNA gyrase subunit A
MMLTSQLFVATTHSHVLLLTSLGRVYAKKVYEIPQAGRTARGKAIVNLLDLKPGESVVQILPVRQFQEGQTVFMATRAGVVKKTDLMDFSDIRSSGIIGILVDDGDKLIGATVNDGNRHVLLATRQGSLIRFPEETVRPMGRTARGVIGIRLDEADQVVSLATLEPDSKADVLSVCENGFGKRTPAEEYRVTNRGGGGVITIRTTERNGPVVAACPVGGDEHLMVITDKGTIIRMPVSGISQVGRAAQGVRLVRLSEGEKVAAVELLAEPEDAATPPAAPPEPEGAAEPEGGASA